MSIPIALQLYSVREELDSVTATLTVVGPVDATKDTIVTIDWADGVGAIQAATGTVKPFFFAHGSAAGQFFSSHARRMYLPNLPRVLRLSGR